MNELIQMVFNDYGYVKKWDCENTFFYYKNTIKI